MNQIPKVGVCVLTADTRFDISFVLFAPWVANTYKNRYLRNRKPVIDEFLLSDDQLL